MSIKQFMIKGFNIGRPSNHSQLTLDPPPIYGPSYTQIERLDETNPTSPRSLNSVITKTFKCPSNGS
ncbi:hypothetical protein MA16_Dca001957 [Dendrobium catenatum]|uniref:Uncharacterized protein n=1 Tax=Dendrobium catenatum TaxID=906689 RepID=A0A2I0XDY9_9ASPA|nr:hypothetical protein MA16_Dca001957 [Dendrobium catenatum]